MSVAFVPFTPTAAGGFSFQATMDGAIFDMRVHWNIFGQRWFITCIAADGALVFTLPVIGSPNDAMINMAAGYFLTSALAYRADTGNFEIWS